LKPGLYRVSVQFKIDKKGKVTEVKARTNDSNAEIEEEAIRVVKKIPNMNPGVVDGKSIGVLYGLPINFKVPENKKKNKGYFLRALVSSLHLAYAIKKS